MLTAIKKRICKSVPKGSETALKRKFSRRLKADYSLVNPQEKNSVCGLYIRQFNQVGNNTSETASRIPIARVEQETGGCCAAASTCAPALDRLTPNQSFRSSAEPLRGLATRW